jgi:hypothetical protein
MDDVESAHDQEKSEQPVGSTVPPGASQEEGRGKYSDEKTSAGNEEEKRVECHVGCILSRAFGDEKARIVLFPCR